MKFNDTHKKLAETAVQPEVEVEETYEQKFLRLVEESKARRRAKEIGMEHGGTQFGTELDTDFMEGSVKSPATIVATQGKPGLADYGDGATEIKGTKSAAEDRNAGWDLLLLRTMTIRKGGPISLTLTVPKDVLRKSQLKIGTQMEVRVYRNGHVRIDSVDVG